MSREYNTEKEYTVWEIIRYNLRMWWLAVIMALLCAAALGGYKYKTLHQFVEKEVYENKQQVVGTLFVTDYSDAGMTERIGNIMKISKSYGAYNAFCDDMGKIPTFEEYGKLFDVIQGESSGVVSFYVTYPVTIGNVTISDEKTAKQFVKGVMDATEKVSESLIGTKCAKVMDEPYVTHEVVKVENYFITQDDFNKAIMKAMTAGVILGIIVEIVLYTFWMLLYKKPKNAEEVRQILDANIIENVKKEDCENIFNKLALYLKNDKEECKKINCISLRSTRKDVALKLAMSYANEHKKTLYVDLGATEENNTSNSIGQYILENNQEIQPVKMNDYLDSVGKNQADEKNIHIVASEKFMQFVNNMSMRYDYIIFNNQDAVDNADAYTVSQLCDTTFVVCGRKNVTNEMLYNVKNTVDINNIQTDGVMIYDI